MAAAASSPRTARMTARPSSSGSIRSSTTSAGRWRSMASSAAGPSAAVTTAKPSRSRYVRTSRTILASSSTTRIGRAGIGGWHLGRHRQHGRGAMLGRSRDGVRDGGAPHRGRGRPRTSAGASDVRGRPRAPWENLREPVDLRGPATIAQRTMSTLPPMMRCPNCGEESPERARFCANCGHPLVGYGGPAGEVRKTVTILFADIVSSTSRGETTDPESTRRMLARYFDSMRRVVERHGGTVEKFIGDAVMAVFGIPRAPRGRRLRAVRRGATRCATAIETLNDELSSSRLGSRSRSGSGSTRARSSPATRPSARRSSPATPVNTRCPPRAGCRPRARSCSAQATYRLVRDAIEAEPMPSPRIEGQGRAGRGVPLARCSRTREPMRRHDTPLVGRAARAADPARSLRPRPRTRMPAICSPCSAQQASASRASSHEFLQRSPGGRAGPPRAGACRTAKGSRSGRSSS